MNCAWCDHEIESDEPYYRCECGELFCCTECRDAHRQALDDLTRPKPFLVTSGNR